MDESIPVVDAHTRKRRKKAFRFSPSVDVDLLKEVINLMPWASDHGSTSTVWKKVADTLHDLHSACVDGKACQRRFNNLL